MYKEEYNIPNIFQLIFEKQNTSRDCSAYCYGNGKERRYSSVNKQCCPYVEYNDIYFDKCPGRTKKTIENKCKNFTCSYFYNYEQTDCSETNIIPDGFYMNDTNLTTIDKCDDNFKTCFIMQLTV